jgi:hypothetical protein
MKKTKVIYWIYDLTGAIYSGIAVGDPASA